MKGRKWFILASFLGYGLIAITLLGRVEAKVKQLEVELQYVQQERELLRGSHTKCIIDNLPDIKLDNIMRALTRWTPMSPNEINYWREKEESRG